MSLVAKSFVAKFVMIASSTCHLKKNTNSTRCHAIVVAIVSVTVKNVEYQIPNHRHAGVEGGLERCGSNGEKMRSLTTVQGRHYQCPPHGREVLHPEAILHPDPPQARARALNCVLNSHSVMQAFESIMHRPFRDATLLQLCPTQKQAKSIKKYPYRRAPNSGEAGFPLQCPLHTYFRGEVKRDGGLALGMFIVPGVWPRP